MKASSIFQLWLYNFLVLLTMLLFHHFAIAEDSIVIEFPVQADAPYAERRGLLSPILGFNFERMTLTQYISEAGEDYQDMFGTRPLDLIQGNVGLKFNLPFGGVALELMYGSGSVSGSLNTEDRKLSLTKLGGGLSLYLDRLFPTPWVVPYMGGQVFTMNYKMSGVDSGQSFNEPGSTALTTGFSIGTLIRLNDLEPDQSSRAQNELGLENTFLDLALTKYNTSNRSTDPDLQTAYNWSAGFKLEF